MSIGDAILCLVDKLIKKKKKVIRLELLQQFQQNEDEQAGKD